MKTQFLQHNNNNAQRSFLYVNDVNEAGVKVERGTRGQKNLYYIRWNGGLSFLEVLYRKRIMSAAAAGAAKSAIEASSDKSLRVPCYCEENVWRLAYRKIHQQQEKKQQQQEKQKQQQKKIKTAAAATTTRTTTSSFQYHVVFISNPKGCAPLFQQLAASDRDSAVFWDYHVILLEQENNSTTTTTNDDDDDNNKNNINNNNDDDQDVTEGTTTTTVLTKNTLVWDIDSYLPFPCHLEDYIEMVFPNNLDWPKEYAPYFRYVIRIL